MESPLTTKNESSEAHYPKKTSNSVDDRNKRKVVYKPFDQKLTFICKFCGGKSCKHENYLTHPESAIKGLNSDWVTSNILATQRPSSRIIKEFDVTKSFKDHGINAIFNLQEPGEHPHCGDGIHPQSGFSYYPEEFYEHGIYFFNFGWKDMTATSTDVVLKILKQMSFSLTNGNKIAIHCHAGRGRTGLIIAAWLIYNNNMTAKEAIKLVRGKRKGSIQSKSQEEVLFRLEKEIKESRMIFHSAPKFKLEDYLFHQKKLLPLSTESEVRFIPNLMLICLERLETLVSSKICTPLEVALAFYNPNSLSLSKGEWTSNHEKTLKTFKDRINCGDFQISDIDDPRYLAQGLLDYFDHFYLPAIKNQFIDAVQENINSQAKLTKEIKDQFFKKLDKKEFLLLECFARFFSKLFDNDEALVDHFRKAILRLCISLVLERKKWDKLFVKRSLMKEHTGDDRVTHLTVFILKWIENFHDSFSEGYMVSRSPLKINERTIREKMHRRGTYIEKLLGGGGTMTSPRDSPIRLEYDGNGRNSISPDNKKATLPRLSGLEDATKQPTQDGSSSEKLGTSPNGYMTPDAKGTPEKKGVHLSSFRAGFSPNPYDNSELRSYDEVKTESKSQSPESSILKKATSGPNFLIKVRSIDSSPSQATTKTNTTRHRVSFIKDDINPFVEESDNRSGSKTTLHKNYDDFFAKNRQITEEGVDTMNKLDNEEESVASETSQLSNEDKFSELLKVIDALSTKKQDIIFERLQKSRAASLVKS